MTLRRRILPVIALLTLSTLGQPPTMPAVRADDDAVAGLIHEARMRKLHLVRPDLIAYPVSFDVVC